MKNHLKFHFPTNLKTYFALLVASLLTIISILFFLQVSEFSQHLYQKILQSYPLYGILTPFVFAFIVYFVKYHCHFVASSGIPQALAALDSRNKSIRSQLLSFRIAVGKIAFIFVAMLFGAPVGIEGPSIHIGASIFYNIRQFITLKRKILIHSFITIGGSIGLLVAFNAPLAALSFAYEEMGREFKKQAIFLIFIVVALVYLVLTLLLAKPAYLASLTLDFNYLLIWQLLPVVIIAGVLGGIFSKTTLFLLAKFKTSNQQKVIFIAFVLGVIVALMNFLSSGATAGSGHAETIKLLNGENLGADFVYLKFIATLSSLVSAIPGGLFMPSISIGAGIGAEISSVFAGFLTIDTQVLLIFTMVAYLSAVIRAPITSALVILEMTTSLNLIIPALIVAFLSSYISSKIQTKSLYSALAKNFSK